MKYSIEHTHTHPPRKSIKAALMWLQGPSAVSSLYKHSECLGLTTNGNFTAYRDMALDFWIVMDGGKSNHPFDDRVSICLTCDLTMTLIAKTSWVLKGLGNLNAIKGK